MANRSKINILFHIRSMEMGGVQKVLIQYLNHLPKDIFEIALLVKLNQGELIGEIPKHIKVYTIGKGKESFSKNYFINKLQLIQRRILLYCYRLFPNFWYKKIENQPDIEIAFDTSSFEAVINSPISSKKVCWLHIDLKNTHSDETINIKLIELMKKFDAQFIVSEYAKNNLKKYYDFDLENSHIVHNPVSCAEINEKANQQDIALKHPSFIAVGRISRTKGHFNLLKVHKRLLDLGLHHYVYILGDGPQRQNLIKEIQKLNAENSFILLGNQNNPYPYIKEADIFIHPSHRESYPMVILESLMLNKPIISTNVGGVPEIIEHNQNGFLINNDDEEIFQVMKEFLTNPDMVERLKQGTQDSNHKFDENKIYQQITRIFESMSK